MEMTPAANHGAGSARSAPDVALSPVVWARVLAVLERLALSSDLEEILTLINDSMRDCLSAERSSVFRYDPVARDLYAQQAHGMDGVLRFPAGSGLAGAAATSRSIINVPDCYADPRFNRDVDQRTGFRTRCMLSIPLMSLDGTLEGVAQVLNKKDAEHGAFTPEDETIARALASQAAVAIRRGSLIEAERRKNKMEADLRVAREIQSATLPRVLPAVAGYSLAACLVAAEETAGDCYDILHVPASDRLWIFVADATGHGVGPAIAVAQAHAMFGLGVLAELRLEAILHFMNQRLESSLPVGRFVCAFLGELNLRTHQMRYIAAGLSPIVRLRPARPLDSRTAAPYPAGDFIAHSCDSTHPPLGLDGSVDGEPGSIILDPGNVLIIATDGVYEQPDASGRPIGPDRVIVRGVSELGASLRQPTPSDPVAAALLRGMLTAASPARAAGEHTAAAPTSLRDDQTLVIVARDADGRAGGK